MTQLTSVRHVTQNVLLVKVPVQLVQHVLVEGYCKVMSVWSVHHHVSHVLQILLHVLHVMLTRFFIIMLALTVIQLVVPVLLPIPMDVPLATQIVYITTDSASYVIHHVKLAMVHCLLTVLSVM
jgi:hypothetical protein